MRLFPLCCWLAALFSCSVYAAEPPSAAALLQQMQRAYHHYNFELSLVKVRLPEIEPLRFSHALLGNREITHLIYLNGRPSEYLQRDDEISFFESGHEPYTLKGGDMPGLWNALLDMDLERVLKSYDPVVTGRNRVAGMAAQMIRLVPKDGTKYGFMLWLEQESGLLLRLDMLDGEGNLVEQYQGVDLRIFPEPSPWLKQLDRAKLPPAVRVSDAYQAPQVPLGWAPGWVPSGFSVASTDRHQLAGTEDLVDYMLLTDGIVDVSIYISPQSAEDPVPRQLVRQGATSLLRFVNDHNVAVTVVGEIPAETAQRIAGSLHPLARGVTP